MENSRNKKHNYTWLVLICIAFLILTLPFHYLPKRLIMFPKENLTFSNTFIFEENINKIINRYNNASLFEKQAIKQEPLYRKLMEKGIIVEEKSKQNFNDIPRATELDFLKEYKDKYPSDVKLLENTIFYNRLKILLGDRCEFLINNFDVETPIEITDGYFVVEACQAHNCGSMGTGFIIVYDFSNDVMSAGVREEGEVKTYSENDETPLHINEWVENK